MYQATFDIWKPRCMRCDSINGVKAESSCTSYHWDGTGEDPNRDVYLCRECVEDHYDYWDSMWAEYQQSMG